MRQGSYLHRHTSSIILKMSQDAAIPPLPAVANLVYCSPLFSHVVLLKYHISHTGAIAFEHENRMSAHLTVLLTAAALVSKFVFD